MAEFGVTAGAIGTASLAIKSLKVFDRLLNSGTQFKMRPTTFASFLPIYAVSQTFWRLSSTR